MHHGHSPNPPRLTPTLTLLPGELYCEREPLCLGTVLGSCVSVCLWDSALRYGGMNHFLLPDSPANSEKSFRFGDVAVPELINRMLSLGSNRRHLQAKLFGGAFVLHAGTPEYAVGRRNVEVAFAELRRCRIPIVASRFSGTQGLVIRQCTDCGDVWVRPVGSADRRRQAYAGVHELPGLADDIAMALIIRDDDGLPVAVRTRTSVSSSANCQTCSLPSVEWRRT